MPPLPRLMLVTDRRRTRGDPIVLVREAVVGGVGLVQVREKDLSDDRLRQVVRSILESVTPETIVLVNGSDRVARTARIGLHLPAGMPLPWPSGARPRGLLLGRSAHDTAEARAAGDEGVDYLILGPVFPTPSKPGHPGHGLELVQRVARELGPVPIFAIGGVTLSRVPAILQAGAHGVAVCGEIVASNDPRRAAEALRLALQVGSGEPAAGA